MPTQAQPVILALRVLRASHIGQGRRDKTCSSRSTTASVASTPTAFDSMCPCVREIGQPGTLLDTGVARLRENMSATNTQNQKMTQRDLARAARTEAIKQLRGNYLKCGDTVYAILRRVSKTGTTRFLDLYCMRDSEPCRITKSAAGAIAMRYDRKYETLRITGCGFDPAEQVVGDLAWNFFSNCDALTRRWF